MTTGGTRSCHDSAILVHATPEDHLQPKVRASSAAATLMTMMLNAAVVGLLDDMCAGSATLSTATAATLVFLAVTGPSAWAKGKRAANTACQALRAPASREVPTVNHRGHGFLPLKKQIQLRQQVAPPDQRMQLAMLLTEISPPQHPSRLCAL